MIRAVQRGFSVTTVSGLGSFRRIAAKWLCTSVPTHSQAASALKVSTFTDIPCPQGVQGLDCERFKLWLENCEKYNLDCDHAIQGIQTGRLTLTEIFEEQARSIKEVADKYHLKAIHAHFRHTIESTGLVEMSSVSPEGVQGQDCERFDVWMANCVNSDSTNCKNQFTQGVQDGRKTQLFGDQQRIISDIQRTQTRSYSSSTPNKGSVGQADSPEASVSAATEPGTPPKELTQTQRLQRAVKEYGSTVVVFHVCLSLASLGGFYLAVSSGVDMVGLLSKMGVGQSILDSKMLAGGTTFVVAYAAHKVIAPVRFAITLTATPLIVRKLRSIGFLKPPKL